MGSGGRLIQDAQRKMTSTIAVDSPAATVATTVVSVTPAIFYRGARRQRSWGEGGAGGINCVDSALCHDAISIEVQWFEDGTQRLGLSRSLAGVPFKALGERGPREEPLLSPKKKT